MNGISLHTADCGTKSGLSLRFSPEKLCKLVKATLGKRSFASVANDLKALPDEGLLKNLSADSIQLASRFIDRVARLFREHRVKTNHFAEGTTNLKEVLEQAQITGSKYFWGDHLRNNLKLVFDYVIPEISKGTIIKNIEEPAKAGSFFVELPLTKSKKSTDTDLKTIMDSRANFNFKDMQVACLVDQDDGEKKQRVRQNKDFDHGNEEIQDLIFDKWLKFAGENGEEVKAITTPDLALV